MQKESESDISKKINAIGESFFLGDFESLKACPCPICGSPSALLFFVVPSSIESDKKNRRGSIITYCIAKCNSMIDHSSGRIPDWVTGDENWEEFSDRLAERTT